MSQTNDERRSVRRLVDWWRSWITRRRTMADLHSCGPAGVEQLAHDLALARADLCILAGKWPASLNFLSRRMEIELDAAEIARVAPEVMRDLQRVCSQCGSQRKCRHDLVRNPVDPHWRDYCPNTTTLTAFGGRAPAPAAGQDARALKLHAVMMKGN
jgi:uncharacterized protein YjiS (DUF1127 family)